MTTTPIVVFDLETTGKDLELDRAVQVAFLKFDSIDAKEPSASLISYVNPDGREIHPEAFGVHGISAEDVKAAPKFREIAHKVKDFIGDSPISGYNIRAFDIPLLMNEFAYAEMPIQWVMERPIIDIRTLWLQKEPRNLAGALKTFCKEDMVDAHDAMADTTAAFKVLRGEVSAFNLQGKTWVELEKEEDPKGEKKGIIGSKSRLQKTDDDIKFLFGKYSGESIVKVAKEHPDYITWIIKGNFEKTLKDIFRRLMKQLYTDWRDPTAQVEIAYD